MQLIATIAACQFASSSTIAFVCFVCLFVVYICLTLCQCVRPSDCPCCCGFLHVLFIRYSWNLQQEFISWNLVTYTNSYQKDKVNVTWVVRNAYHFHFRAPCLFHRFASYAAQTDLMRGWCVAYHFHIKQALGQCNTSQLIISTVPTSWLHSYWTDSLYMRYQ